jgi:hypothetical protein
MHGVRFVLFIQDGRLDFLEGFTYGELWPEIVELRRWFYLRDEAPDCAGLIEPPHRDLQHVASELAP